MYNLIVKSGGWHENSDEFTNDRIFEHTELQLERRHEPKDARSFSDVLNYPVMLLEEGIGDEPVRLGRLLRCSRKQFHTQTDYAIDRSMPTLVNSDIVGMRMDFGITDRFEFSRTHWAIKDVDLYQVLLRKHTVSPTVPSVFKLNPHERTQDNLVAVMMPFDASFNDVFTTIKKAAKGLAMKCERVDTIWDDDAIINDVVSLINRAKVVICDLTGRNPNVFYETGIAHTLGKRVIMITQSSKDVPFDVQHNRYISYLHNGEGLEALTKKLTSRLDDLLSK